MKIGIWVCIKKRANVYMKYNTVIILCLLFINVTIGFGQISVGIKTSALFTNISRMYGNFGNRSMATKQTDYCGLVGGLNLGFIGNLAISDYFSLQTGLNFKQQGIEQEKYKFETITLSYLEIPVFLEYQKTIANGIFVDIGPSLKCLVNAEYSYNPGERKYIWVNKVFEPLVFTINCGVGDLIRLYSCLYLEGEIRFGYDLTQVVHKTDNIKLPSGDEWYFRNAHMLQMQANIGLRYKF